MQAHERQSLEQHADRLAGRHLRELLREPDRYRRFSRRLGPMLLDFSKQRLDQGALGALGEIAEARGWRAARDAMFGGEPINRSENRAVLHTALRAFASRLPALAPAETVAEIDATRERMLCLADAVAAGQSDQVGLAPGITDVVNLGIGGSDLGPRLAVNALSGFHVGGVRCHFLPNVDGHEIEALMRRLDPRRTLVLLVSKSFTTQETLLNGAVLREWIAGAYGNDAGAAARHFIAVSANVEAAARFGVPAERVLPMWDFVGGRYSIWSAVGLVVAMAIGGDAFRALLRGAASIDDHFRAAPWQDNLPVLSALVGVWNRNGLGYPSQAVIPYHDRLALLPGFLQQLEMESLGKRVGPDGEPVAQATVPVVWGEVGTNAQHAFFQALHQGTDVVPVEFVGVVEPDHALRENHDALLANLLAQSAALALGKSEAEALAEAAGSDERERLALARQRTFPGNRPSTTVLLDRLDPESLGALLALYEHKVLVQSVLWEINAFDQWGVELGKQIARSIGPALRAEAHSDGFDASTAGLIEAIRSRRGR